MMEEFELKGVWWFPQFPDHQVAGILKFHPIDGATLETLGDSFWSEIFELYGDKTTLKEVPMIAGNPTIDIICGDTNKGDPVTLCKCFQGGGNWARGYIGSMYQVEVVFIGCHFEKEEDIVFDSMAIRYTHLEQWLGLTGFSSSFNITQEGKCLDGEVKYAPSERFETRIDDLGIAFCHSLQIATDRFVDFHLRQTSFIEITPDYPMHYNDYHRKVIYYLRNFLSLGVGTAVFPISMIGINQNYTIETPKNEHIPNDIHIYFAAEGANLHRRKQLEQWRMTLSYPDVSDNFQKYLQNWFMKAELLGPVIDLYFGIFYIPSMYVHLEFLTLAQALEAYHRRVYEGQYMTEDEYQPIRQTLNKAIPNHLKSSHQDRLKGIIKYGYEYSLRKRLDLILNDVLAPYKDTVDRLIGDRTDFILKLKDTRNYLTHYTKELEEIAITDEQEQRKFIQKMKQLMQLCFFVELGFSPEMVDKLVSGKR